MWSHGLFAHSWESSPSSSSVTVDDLHVVTTEWRIWDMFIYKQNFVCAWVCVCVCVPETPFSLHTVPMRRRSCHPTVWHRCCSAVVAGCLPVSHTHCTCAVFLRQGIRKTRHSLPKIVKTQHPLLINNKSTVPCAYVRDTQRVLVVTITRDVEGQWPPCKPVTTLVFT